VNSGMTAQEQSNTEKMILSNTLEIFIALHDY
jgi:hypothetical protein